LRPVLLSLSKGADVLFAFGADELSGEQALQQMQTLAKPQGEYMAAPLINWYAALTELTTAN